MTTLPPRYETLIRYCRDQQVTRITLGRTLQWLAPQNRPWLSLRRWLGDIALPTSPRTARLYAIRDNSEIILTDFAFGTTNPPPDTASGSRASQGQLDRLEEKLDRLDDKLDTILELLGQDEDDDEETVQVPAWLQVVAGKFFAEAQSGIAGNGDKGDG